MARLDLQPHGGVSRAPPGGARGAGAGPREAGSPAAPRPQPRQEPDGEAAGGARDGWIERRSQLQQDGPQAARGRAPGTSQGGRARHPLPGRLRPGEAARA